MSDVLKRCQQKDHTTGFVSLLCGLFCDIIFYQSLSQGIHVALDQVEYQKRYDGLTERFDTAKARYEVLDETIHSKQSRRATIEAFLEALAKAELVDKFETTLWCGLVDFVTIHSKDDVRFTFKNGQEIRA